MASESVVVADYQQSTVYKSDADNVKDTPIWVTNQAMLGAW